MLSSLSKSELIKSDLQMKQLSEVKTNDRNYLQSTFANRMKNKSHAAGLALIHD